MLRRLSFVLALASAAPLAAQPGTVAVESLPPEATATAAGAPLTPGVPVAVDARSVLVRVTFADGTSLEEWVMVSGRDMTLDVDPEQYRMGVVAFSVLAPGLAQWQNGARGSAAALWGGLAAGGATAVIGQALFREARTDYDELVLAYDRALSEEDAVRIREAAVARGQDVSRLRTLRTVGASVALAVYLAAIADTAVRHAERPALSVRPATPVTVGLATDRPGLSLRVSL